MKLLSISDDNTCAIIEMDEWDAAALCNLVVAVQGLFSAGDIPPRIGVMPDHLERMYTAADEIVDLLRGHLAG